MAKKKAKAAAKKPAARKAPKKLNARQPAAPAAKFPMQAHVLKGGDKIPVTLVDQAHLDRLRSEHGESSVEVSQ